MIYLLLVALIIIFILNLNFNNKDFGAPSVIFSMSFLFSTLCGCIFQSIWGIDIQFTTVVIVLFYVITFSLVCVGIKNFNNNVVDEIVDMNCYDEPLDLNLNVMRIVLIIFAFLTILYMQVLMIKTGSTNMAEAIGGTYSLKLETLDIPFYFRLYIAITQAVGYWISYVFVRNILLKKFELTALLLFLLCFATNLLSGSRGVAVCMILSIPANLLLQGYRNNKHLRNINIKKILLTMLIVPLALWIFVNSERWLGRATVSSWSAFDSLGAYCGAELYNLDKFLKSTSLPHANQFGVLTFSSLLRTISKYFGMSYIKQTAYRFQEINGHFLGNVFTMFYEPLYDFGIFGGAVVIILYAMISQVVYNSATNIFSDNNVPFSISFYGYLFPLLAVSFFAWWFGNYVVSTSFIYIIISWKLCNYFFLEIRFNYGGKPIK